VDTVAEKLATMVLGAVATSFTAWFYVVRLGTAD